MHCMLMRNDLRSQYSSNCIADKAFLFLGCLCVYQLQWTFSANEPGSSVVFYIFIREIRLSGVRASSSIVRIQRFYEM